MKVLLCHPGASIATADVYTGYRDALTAMGIECIEYLLDDRLEIASRHLKALFNHADRHLPKGERRKPNSAQVQWQACNDLIPQALWHGVDFVLHFSAQYFHPDFLIMLRRAGIPNVALLTESPYADDYHERLLQFIDVAFVNERTSVERLRHVNSDVYYLPCGRHAAHHQPDAATDDDLPAHDVVFVGTGFQERLDLLAAVDWDGIDLGLYGTFGLLPSRHPLRRYVRGGVMGNDKAVALYRKAAINLNLYRTSTGWGVDAPRVTGAESLNPRAVELAACGVFHLSEDRPEVGEVFGATVPTFSTATELSALVRRWLPDATGRAALARQLPDRVAHLSFDAHARTLVTTLRNLWSGRTDMAQAAD